MQKVPKNRAAIWKISMMLPLLAGMLTIVACENSLNFADDGPKGEALTVAELTTVAEYPGGMEGLYEYMGQNIKYTPEAKEKGIEGKIIVEFTISESGEIGNSKIDKGLGFGLDEHVLAMVNAMPDWNPAEKDGMKVKSQMKLPVVFKLNPPPPPAPPSH